MIATNTDRYAIYFTFSPQDSLYRKATHWLGHCVYNSETTNKNISDSTQIPDHLLPLRQSVTQAAKYGFHATLKPPFRLNISTSLKQMKSRLNSFSSTTSAFYCSPLEVRVIGNFIALVPLYVCQKLDYLARKCVQVFEPYRAALNEVDMRKRFQAGLSSNQIKLLSLWGYPYVLDEFRFHMTLTDNLSNEALPFARQMLGQYFSSELESPLYINQICLFHQQNSESPFYLIECYPLKDSNEVKP